jgi:hypothetical protein
VGRSWRGGVCAGHQKLEHFFNYLTRRMRSKRRKREDFFIYLEEFTHDKTISGLPGLSSRCMSMAALESHPGVIPPSG